MKKLYLLFALSMIMGTAMAQPKFIRCYSDEHLKDQVKQNPERGKSLDVLDARVDEMVTNKKTTKNGNSSGISRSNTVYIPVVVNVVYHTAAENISDAQVQSQIDVLNKDFTATNIEILNSGSYNFAGYFGLVANCKIQFCLYKTVRTATTVTSFGTNDDIKKTAAGGQDPHNPQTMLNMWSCNLGFNLLGYAQFPSGPAKTDGVVILYSAFGTSAGGATLVPYAEGRTATHEVGHWLGLRHIWGVNHCGNDKVDDTPLQDAPNFGCPSPGLTSSCKPAALEQYMNYMDYVEDLCMYMFSNGQLERMNGYIAQSRAPYCLDACPGAASRTVTANLNQNRLAPVLTAERLSLYPSVTPDFTNLVIPSMTSGMGEITLLSQSGTVIRRQMVAMSAGNTSEKLFVGNLPNGLYLIKTMAADGKTDIKKLVVQH